MNAERFTFYIKNPAHLYQITYTELKSLVLQYPYCQNLRYLLLKKSILENHKELGQNLQLAATFSMDRIFLYQQIKDGDSYVSEADNFLLKEDYLELKDLGPEVAPEEIANTSKQEEGASVLLNIEKPDEVIQDQIAIPSSALVPEELENELSDQTISEPDLLEPSSPENPEPPALEDIEEEEFVDITEEMEGLFVEQAPSPSPEILVANTLSDQADESSPQKESPKEENLEDEAISIEELIKLDNMSPLERLEKTKKQTKSKKEHTETETNEDLEGMKKKEFDFEELDALIEKTKKDVALEITNEEFLDVTEKEEPLPSPKSSFGSWLKQFQSNEKELDQKETFDLPDSKINKPKKKKKKKRQQKKSIDNVAQKVAKFKKKEKQNLEKEAPKKAKIIAQKSLKENAEIVSETLAKLLVRQESYKKAIKMYEKLSLIFPEKSSFFAEQIKKLKNLQQ